jgi:hypothetical protein
MLWKSTKQELHPVELVVIGIIAVDRFPAPVPSKARQQGDGALRQPASPVQLAGDARSQPEQPILPRPTPTYNGEQHTTSARVKSIVRGTNCQRAVQTLRHQEAHQDGERQLDHLR